jgi:hypothetical protein
MDPAFEGVDGLFAVLYRIVRPASQGLEPFGALGCLSDGDFHDYRIRNAAVV